VRKCIFLVLIFLLVAGLLRAEHFTLYAGRTSVKTELWGVALGADDIWSFLQFQMDFFKYMNKDKETPGLFSEDPALNRSDFLALSGNFVLRIPIHLLPHLYKFNFIEPYISKGIGACLESTATAFMDVLDLKGKTGVFSKIRRFDSFGGGVIIWVIPKMGLKLDFRSIKIAQNKNMNWPARKFSRFTFGLCF
jgi:hypothetical protein